MRTLDEISIHQVNICHGPVDSMHGDETLLAALKKMREHGHSGIAIIDYNNKLIGNLSMADIKYLFKVGKISFLWKTCSEFISKALIEEGIERGRVSFHS
jgi:predicted transcriptional regulator